MLDLSGPDAHTAAQAAAAGHHVIQLRDPSAEAELRDPGGNAEPPEPVGNVSNGAGSTPPHGPPPPPGNVSNGNGNGNGSADGAGRPHGAGPADDAGSARGAGSAGGAGLANGNGAARGHGSLHPVIADSESLACLADTSLDAVVADDRALSRHLATEATVAEIARVLRPGGRLFFSVDSLTLGMAILAEQNYWAHLSDVPAAEVLLIPWPDGTITRCFQADQLRELLTGAGLEVEWIRPRTTLSPSTVEHLLTGSPKALSRLVRTELTAPLGDESLGIHLLASARRPGPHFNRR
ncbi:methyltransferase domain-containing protein [Actinomadura barringtoniae]|uniref:Methyltransferase domain-containing protein n=1 Tax=Actinomadura barringtoniae TaxID=1427535 RepID=A0A939PCX7_9ACTN|nr:methyltransferase domain-containing protein [Actinomadura barringtoniae]